MKRYILLGIGIGIIFTNIILSLIPKETVDINSIVEEEVQKRLKRVHSFEEVEKTFQEAVEIKSEKLNFPKDTKPNAIYYVLVNKSKNNGDIIKFKDDLSSVLETKIELIGKESYLFSSYPYTKTVSDEILKYLNETYQIKGKIFKNTEYEKLKKN